MLGGRKPFGTRQRTGGMFVNCQVPGLQPLAVHKSMPWSNTRWRCPPTAPSGPMVAGCWRSRERVRSSRKRWSGWMRKLRKDKAYKTLEFLEELLKDPDSWWSRHRQMSGNFHSPLHSESRLQSYKPQSLWPWPWPHNPWSLVWHRQVMQLLELRLYVPFPRRSLAPSVVPWFQRTPTSVPIVVHLCQSNQCRLRWKPSPNQANPANQVPKSGPKVRPNRPTSHGLATGAFCVNRIWKLRGQGLSPERRKVSSHRVEWQVPGPSPASPQSSTFPKAIPTWYRAHALGGPACLWRG